MKKISRILMLMMGMMLICNTLMAIDIDPEKQQSTKMESPNPDLINEDGDPEPDVYWYFIRMRIDSKRKEIEIMGTGTKAVIGSIKGFSKAVWWGIAHRQVTIGPFYSEAEATNSKIYYKKSKDKINELPQATAPSTMHWFQVSFVELKRLGSYEYTRSPAAVSSGSASQFVDALYEGLTFSRLSVGPFWDYTRAEEAKAIYRLNE
ncbi:MAG: hypothetical protein IKQ46_04370 [Bacteroidales bacterium]|jgi:hypothetical protein|nr:hypothetical protein [Bacteroidales bacterium]